MIKYYKEREFKAKDFRDLSDMDRKLFVQRIINQVLYSPSRFKATVKLLEEWEKNSNNLNEN